MWPITQNITMSSLLQYMYMHVSEEGTLRVSFVGTADRQRERNNLADFFLHQASHCRSNISSVCVLSS